MFKYKFRKKKTTEAESEYIDKQVKRLPKIISIAFFVYFILFIVGIIWYFCFNSIYYISVITGSSMQPTINVGLTDENNSEDFVYVNSKKQAKRGDIVIISTPDKNIIKRVIASEGDYVSIFIADDGFYHVSLIENGSSEPQILNENYIKSYQSWTTEGHFKSVIIDDNVYYEKYFYDMFIKDVDVEESDYFENTQVFDGVYYAQVPENCYFCLGDNRASSSDSRLRGFFEEENLKGVAEIIVKGGSKKEGWLFGKKLKAILSFYWSKIEDAFSR